jgi:hypothetical protein
MFYSVQPVLPLNMSVPSSLCAASGRVYSAADCDVSERLFSRAACDDSWPVPVLYKPVLLLDLSVL